MTEAPPLQKQFFPLPLAKEIFPRAAGRNCEKRSLINLAAISWLSFSFPFIKQNNMDRGEESRTSVIYFNFACLSAPVLPGAKGGGLKRYRNKLKQQFRSNNRRIPWRRLTNEKKRVSRSRPAFPCTPVFYRLFPHPRGWGWIFQASSNPRNSRRCIAMRGTTTNFAKLGPLMKGFGGERESIGTGRGNSLRKLLRWNFARSFLPLVETIDINHSSYVILQEKGYFRWCFGTRLKMKL